MHLLSSLHRRKRTTTAPINCDRIPHGCYRALPHRAIFLYCSQPLPLVLEIGGVAIGGRFTSARFGRSYSFLISKIVAWEGGKPQLTHFEWKFSKITRHMPNPGLVTSWHLPLSILFTTRNDKVQTHWWAGSYWRNGNGKSLGIGNDSRHHRHCRG